MPDARHEGGADDSQIDAAQAWYDSPPYQDALVHRLKGVEYHVFIVEGVPKPRTWPMDDLKPFDFATIANGDHFHPGKHEFMVTDKGTRTLIGVEIDDKARADPTWIAGPPYAVVERVFDEDDMEVISLQPPIATAETF